MLEKSVRTEKLNRLLIAILFVGAVLVNVKSVFLDYEVDTGYAVAMAYRMAKGDRMFVEMWEAHQTSAFICAALIKVYLMLFKTTTGILVFLHAISAILYCASCYFLYKVVVPHLNRTIAYLMLIVLCTMRAKDYLVLEFSNLQIMFSLLLAGCMIQYLLNSSKKRWLIGAALALCAETLAYPSSVITLFAVILLLVLYSEHCIRDSIIFVGVCIICGLAYVSYFICQVGFEEMIYAIEHIFLIDDYHNGSIPKQRDLYFKTLLQSVMQPIGICCVAFLLALMRSFVKKRKLVPDRMLWLKLFIIMAVIVEIVNIVIRRDRFSHTWIFLLLPTIMLIGWRKCIREERIMMCSCALISFCSFVATTLLSDLDIAANIRYLILMVAVSFIAIAKMMDNKLVVLKYPLPRYFILVTVCFVLVFRRGFMVRTMDGGDSNLFDIRGIIKQGPEMGIISDYMGTYDKNCSVEDWRRYITEDDCVMLVGDMTVDAINHLYVDATISDSSTVSTPTYNVSILDYWKVNPHKFPNVIAVQCWYGELRIEENSWVMNWINDEFMPDEVWDGRYWRFYRKYE